MIKNYEQAVEESGPLLMDYAKAISDLQDAFLSLDQAIGEADGRAKLYGVKLHEDLVARLSGLSLATREAARADVLEHILAARADMMALVERHAPAALEKCHTRFQLSDLQPAIEATARRLAEAAIQEYDSTHAEEIPAAIRREFATIPKTESSRVFTLADCFRGNWTKELALRRGDIFTFRGACYIVLRDSRGVLPTQQEQKPPNPRYQVLAAPGAPGPRGVDGAGGGAGSGNLQSGTVSLSQNDTSKAIAFSAFSSAPDLVASIAAPSGGDIISCVPDFSTITTTAATILFAAAIPASGYKLCWFANKT